MNTQVLLVAIAMVAAFGIVAMTIPVLAQNMTGSENMTALGDNMTQPLEDVNMTAGG